MARPKEFERELVLQQAIEAFSNSGFAGTSTEAVLAAMGISRQSMYDTFGDKRQLYLEALRRYLSDSVAAILRSIDSAAGPLAGIEAALLDFAARPAATAALGCLGVASICEFGQADAEVAALNKAAARRLRDAFEAAVLRAQGVGEIPAELDAPAAARFIVAMFSSIKIAARGGESRAALRELARMALRGLVAPPAPPAPPAKPAGARRAGRAAAGSAG